MNALTQPIDIITARQNPRRWATWLAYFGFFKVMASEAFLYLIGWQAWTVLSAIYFFGAVWLLVKERRRDVLSQMPWALRALLLLMLLSLGWTNYPMYTRAAEDSGRRSALGALGFAGIRASGGAFCARASAAHLRSPLPRPFAG